MADRIEEFKRDSSFRNKVVGRIISDAKKKREKQINDLKIQLQCAKKTLSVLEEQNYKTLWKIVIEDVLEVNDTEKLILINGNIYNFSDVVTYNTKSNNEKMEITSHVGYKTRNKPSFLGMVAGSEYGYLGSVVGGTMLGEQHTTPIYKTEKKKVNTYRAIDIELKNSFETIVINDEPIEAGFKNMAAIVSIEVMITSALDLAIRNAFDKPEHPVNEKLVNHVQKIKKLEYELKDKINSKPIYEIPEKYQSILKPEDIDYFVENGTLSNKILGSLSVDKNCDKKFKGSGFLFGFSLYISFGIIMFGIAGMFADTETAGAGIVFLILGILINPYFRRWLDDTFFW